MNRFKIILGEESSFEEIWKTRETHLDNVKGFKKLLNEFISDILPTQYPEIYKIKLNLHISDG